MSTIAENLQVIYDIKEDIKTAIESKGVGVGDAPFTNYADKIGEITVGGDCEGVYQEGYNNGYNNGFRESMLNVFNTIGIVEGKTIDIPQTVYDRLTTEDIQIATNKGWIINVK